QHTPESEPRAEELSLQAARSRTGTGYRLEILLPWSNLPSVEPELGTRLALQVHVVDLDGETRTPYTWFPAGNASANPQSMEWIRLEERASEPIVTQAGMVTGEDGQILRVIAHPESAGRVIRIQSGAHVL